jgi:hypothetical protein
MPPLVAYLRASSQELTPGRRSGRFMEFVNWGIPPAEFQLMLMETALRVLSAGALATVAAASLTYFLLWLAEFRHAARRRVR